jgi:hypothetical protein
VGSPEHLPHGAPGTRSSPWCIWNEEGAGSVLTEGRSRWQGTRVKLAMKNWVAVTLFRGQLAKDRAKAYGVVARPFIGLGRRSVEGRETTANEVGSENSTVLGKGRRRGRGATSSRERRGGEGDSSTRAEEAGTGRVEQWRSDDGGVLGRR